MFRISEELKEEKILKKYIPNYRINLIDAGNMEHLEQFYSDLQQVLGMLQCRSKKERLQKYIQENREYFENVDVETYQAVRVFLQSGTMMKELPDMKKEEKINMCQAMEEWYADAVQEGVQEGREEGQIEGRRKEKTAIIIKMLEGGLTPDEIKRFTGGTDEEIEQARLEAACGDKV